MIGYLEGTLLKREEDRILLLVNQVGYEVLLPAFVMETLSGRERGEELSLFIYYHQTERQPKPTLIGFNLEAEKEFFQHFISVEAIGPMKAAGALALPVRDIARAIEGGDAGTLVKLPGIGKRTAQKIIATLEGKVGKFALISGEEGKAAAAPAPVVEDFAEQVLEVLVTQLGHRNADAREMIAAALSRNGEIATPEELFDEIYRGEVDR